MILLRQILNNYFSFNQNTYNLDMFSYNDEYFTVEPLADNVIKYKLSEKESTDESIKKYLEILDQVFSLEKRYIAVYDTSKSKFMSANHRIQLGAWTKLNKQKIIDYNHCTIFLVTSLMFRIVLNGIFVVEKPVYDYSIVGSEAQMLSVIEEKLKTI